MMDLYRLSLFLVAISSTAAFSPGASMMIRSSPNLPTTRASRLHVLLEPHLQENETTKHSVKEKPELLQVAGVADKSVNFLAKSSNESSNESSAGADEQDILRERTEQILFQMTLYRFALFLAMTAPLVPTQVPATASHSQRQILLDPEEQVVSSSTPPEEEQQSEQVFDLLVNKNRKGALQDMEERSDRLSLDISKTAYSATMKSPPDAYISFAEKGASNAHLPKRKILHQSILGGCYVGFGGLVSLMIAGNLGAGLSANSPGVAKMIFALLFPINLLLIVATSGQLFTGNSATVTAARFEGFVSNKDMRNSFALSLLGNIIGCTLFAKAAMIAQIMNPGAIDLVTKTAIGKCCAAGVGATVIKAIMCNWMVSMAVYLATAANDLPGKVFGIYLPISTFVGIGTLDL
jgi:formate/nitrite transporter FocA (FNT family)